MKNIMSIDPSGLNTGTTGHIGGYVLKLNKDNSGTNDHFTFFFELNELSDLVSFLHNLKILISQNNIDILIIEDFVNYEAKQYAFKFKNNATSETIGAIKSIAFEFNIPFIMQKASEVKTRWSDKVLLTYNILNKVKKDYYLLNSKQETSLTKHERDAIRHAYHFYKKNREKFN